MYLYAHYSSAKAAYDALEDMYASGEVFPSEVYAVKPLPRPNASGNTRIGIYLKDAED